MESAVKDLRELLSTVKTLQEALDIKKKWNKDYLDPLHACLSSASGNDKHQIGKKFNTLRRLGDEVFEEVKCSLNKDSNLGLKVIFPEINTNLVRGSFNPLSEIRTTLIQLFNGLGFLIESGKEVVSIYENFEDLEVPLDHPSRSDTQTFYISGDAQKILRPHCTVHSVQRLKKESNNVHENFVFKLVTIGSVYRRDDETPRHTHQFSQLDFIWLQKDLTVAHLKYFLEVMCGALFGKDRDIRFRNSYFPFTNPSVELDVKCNCSGDNCRICGGSGWIEIMGSGLFRKEIIEKTGYSADYECLAGGFGLERIALIKYGISDIRHLYEGNLDFLNDQFLDDSK